MKFLTKLAVTSAVIAFAFISTANAQSMRVEVPFGFHAGNQSLPAGTYKVQMNQTSQRVILNQLDGKANCFLSVSTFTTHGVSGQASLIFNRYGSSYFLTRVKEPAAGVGAQLFTSRAEREFAKVQPESKTMLIIASGR